MSALRNLLSGVINVGVVAKRQTVQLLKDMVVTLASLCLPKHTKRLTCLVALHRHLVDVHVLRTATLTELNEKLNLAVDEQALKLPDRYYARIWRSEDIRSLAEIAGILHTNEPVDNMDQCVRVFCQQLAKTSPPHLRYSSTEDLFNDFVELVKQIGGHTLARA